MLSFQHKIDVHNKMPKMKCCSILIPLTPLILNFIFLISESAYVCTLILVGQFHIHKSLEMVVPVIQGEEAENLTFYFLCPCLFKYSSTARHIFKLVRSFYLM